MMKTKQPILYFDLPITKVQRLLGSLKGGIAIGTFSAEDYLMPIIMVTSAERPETLRFVLPYGVDSNGVCIAASKEIITVLQRWFKSIEMKEE